MLASRVLIILSFFRISMMSFLYSAGKTLASILAGSVEQALRATTTSNNHDRDPTILMIMSSPVPGDKLATRSRSAHPLRHACALRCLRGRSSDCADTPERLDGSAVPRFPRAADRTPQRFVNGFACKPNAAVERLHQDASRRLTTDGGA